MMTAANLGARLTGWGFVVFTLGSLCWIGMGLTTGQTSLIVANAALTLINLIGIWRWLGRQRVYEDGGSSAKRASRKAEVPTLFTATGIAGMPLVSSSGAKVGNAVEALIECQSGTISYVVISTAGAAGIDETLRAVPGGAITFGPDRLVLDMPRQAFHALPALCPDKWPASA